ncbi:MAG: integrase core domain-containing protein [Candidatus Woesearchaeota archaeon]
MYKLNYGKRIWLIKQKLKGISPSKLALAQNVSESYVRRLMRIYAEFGFDGLKDHKTGRPELVINFNAEIVIVDLRTRFKWGAVRIEQHLKNKGFSISHRQIEKILNKHNLVVPNYKKQKSRKWVRFELPNPNDMWHTDWTHCPFTDKHFAVYIDDRTRLITSYGVFKNANIINSLALLKSGMADFGKPKSVMTDHGSTYFNNTPDSKGILQLNKFQLELITLGIKHSLAPVNRPQTNGKVERFFRTYKEEYITETFSNIKDFITHYNTERPHMSLHYQTPQQVWNSFKNRN